MLDVRMPSAAAIAGGLALYGRDVETVSRALALLAENFRQRGRYPRLPGAVESEMTRYGAYGGHHLGTARMGHDPRTSVVDRNCRVHGVANLFVASAATFPTSSQANPTLTVVALSLRLASRLRSAPVRGLRRRSPATMRLASPERRAGAGRYRMTLRILVLGASGFIGRHLLAALAGSDWASPLQPAGACRSGRPAHDMYVSTPPMRPSSAARCKGHRGDQLFAGNVETMSPRRARCWPPQASGRAASAAGYQQHGGRRPATPDNRIAPLRATDPYGRATAVREKLWLPSAVIWSPESSMGPAARNGPGVSRAGCAPRLGDLGAAGDGICNLLYIGDLVHALGQRCGLPRSTAGYSTWRCPSHPPGTNTSSPLHGRWGPCRWRASAPPAASWKPSCWRRRSRSPKCCSAAAG